MPTLEQIAEWIADAGHEFSEAHASTLALTWLRVSGLEDAAPDTAVFVTDAATLAKAAASRAGLILAPLALTHDTSDVRIVRVRDPRLAFSLLARQLAAPASQGIHPSAVIYPGAQLARNVEVGPGTVIYPGVHVGAGSRLGARVVLEQGITLGERVVVQAGAVLGSYGFGYARRPSGEYVLFPQQGTLVIEDDVEIGANTTIDRGALGETRIGAGTKIDNLVHIGHNCRIGRNVILAAQTGISGSTVVQDGAILGGQVGIGEHATVGPGVILGGGAGVLSGKKLFGAGQVFWGRPAQPLRQYLRDLARLRRGA
ncbi:UDP-3-O-(3-hydroxymyristoyl)glucosamine N-acyltransferase [Terriglobus sp.]|uniref:UDP-3-O-(3-hydroxymyristoyl)glucosamine N-acyltransferase n=1 Tax=Terriglobus sp. TaxID=1889013 RepID=UPI003B00B729